MDHSMDLVSLSKSYVRDSTYVIDILNEILGTLYVISHCTNIPCEEGIQAISEMLAIHIQPHALPHKIIS